jgi:tRNA(adenine34) deaminase
MSDQNREQKLAPTKNAAPTDEQFMRRAIALARQAEALGEVPVGCVIVRDGEIIGEGFNQPIVSHDPSAHAEIIALRDAAKKTTNYRLTNATLYVTIEPCTMCVGAMMHARIKHIVFGALESKAGALVSHLQLADQNHFNHQLSFTQGVLATECGELISNFFRTKRQAK